MAPQRIWFLQRFGLKTGIDFAYFGLNSGMVFEGIRIDKHICRFNSKWKRKKGVICEFEMDFKQSFCRPSSLSNDNMISAYAGLKMGVENDKFLVWNGVGIWRIGQHTPTMNFQEYLPGVRVTAILRIMVTPVFWLP